MTGRINLLYLLILFGVCHPISAWAWSGEVVGVEDGDIIIVYQSRTLREVETRLYGIETPERGQAFDQEAKQFTSKTVYGKVVEVDVMAKDRQGRTVAMVFVEQKLLNEELVKHGLAWVYWKYCHHPICESWKNFQLKARFDKRGVWADSDRTPPWIYRKQRKK